MQLSKIKNNIEYMLDIFKVKRTLYVIDEVSIKGSSIYVTYFISRGVIKNRKADVIENILSIRSHFNYVDQLKIDTCYIYQDTIVLINDLDVELAVKHSLISKLKSKMLHRLGY